MTEVETGTGEWMTFDEEQGLEDQWGGNEKETERQLSVSEPGLT